MLRAEKPPWLGYYMGYNNGLLFTATFATMDGMFALTMVSCIFACCACCCTRSPEGDGENEFGAAKKGGAVLGGGNGA